MTILDELKIASPEALARIALSTAQSTLPASKWDNRPSWDNGPRWDSRPTWDNWSKSK